MIPSDDAFLKRVGLPLTMHDTVQSDPIAFFLTISTYGTWLPGDQRGWVEYRRGWQLPDPIRELEALAKTTEDACIFSMNEQRIVEQQLAETCQHRHWTLHAKTCRTNHLHAVISAPNTAPKKIRVDIKAWCTRRLKEQSNPNRQNWWAERGSIRWVYDMDQLERVIHYIDVAQDLKHLDG